MSVRPEMVDHLVGLLTLDPSSLGAWKSVDGQPTYDEVVAAMDLQAEIELVHTDATLSAFAMIMPYQLPEDELDSLEAAFHRMPATERSAYAARMAALGIPPY